MCSWCYAFATVLGKIESKLPNDLVLRKIVGGLAPDSNEPMPIILRNSIRAAWMNIETTVSDIHFNYKFWDENQPLRSTYPACRAVLAAKKQSAVFENKMIKKIQWAYYQNAENPSLDSTLIACAQKIGVDMAVFKNDFKGQFIEKELQAEIMFARELGVASYPSLVLQNNEKLIEIAIDYNDSSNILNQIQ